MTATQVVIVIVIAPSVSRKGIHGKGKLHRLLLWAYLWWVGGTNSGLRAKDLTR